MFSIRLRKLIGKLWSLVRPTVGHPKWSVSSLQGSS